MGGLTCLHPSQRGDTMFRCMSCATVWEDGRERCPFCGGLRVDRAYTPPVHAELLRERVLTHLRPLTDRLVASLAEIARKKVSEEAYLIEFEVHYHFFSKQFAIRWDAMDETNSQLEEEDG